MTSPDQQGSDGALKPASPGGANTHLGSLIHLRFAAREISLAPPARARQLLAGMVASSARGRGIDFAEVRTYEPGDDVRTIDWRVTARTGTAHTKLFQEDRERPVFILVDQSRSMYFGSRRAFKSVCAAETAALIAWCALERGDRVGGLVFDDSSHREIRPRRNKKTVLRLLGEIHKYNQKPGARQNADQPPDENACPLATPLESARRLINHGALVFVLSDFQSFDGVARNHLQQLARFNEVVGVCISDPLERELPPPDVYTITNGVERTRLNTRSSAFRSQFRQAHEARVESLQDTFSRCRARLLELSTSDPVVATVRDLLITPIAGRAT